MSVRGGGSMNQQVMDRNLALELLRVTEGAALAAAPLQGRGVKEEADQRAVDAIDGPRLTANGQPGALSVVALAERGSMFTTHIHYMEKLVVGRRARGVIDIDMPVDWNLRRIGKAEGLHPRDLVVVILDRDRNQDVIRQVREVGARVRLISDGDVAGAIMAALETKTGMHVLMGSGGATEGVVAACAIKALGGDMQARLLIRNDEERAIATSEGYKEGTVLGLDDLCSGQNIFFAATGITTGELLHGVRYEEHYAFTHSTVLRSASGTMRFVEAYHPMTKLRSKGLLPEQVVLSV